jgi:predicted ester cyclase
MEGTEHLTRGKPPSQTGFPLARHDKRMMQDVRHMRPVGELVTIFYGELWNRWDDSLVEEILSPDFEFRGSLGETTSGLDAWRSYRDRIRSSAPDFHNYILELITDGDRAAAHLRYSGTHLGTMLGFPASSRRFGYDGAAFFAAAGEQLVQAWVLGDLYGLVSQLSRPHED